MKNMEELIEYHRNFAEKIIKANRGFRPQIVISVKNEIIPFLIMGDDGRYTIKTVLNKVNKLTSSADWIIIMHEAYYKASLQKQQSCRTICWHSGRKILGWRH